MDRCTCCRAPADYSILLCETEGRFYLPNQHARSAPLELAAIQPRWFCNGCLRIVEDTLRGVLDGLITAHEKYGR